MGNVVCAKRKIEKPSESISYSPKKNKIDSIKLVHLYNDIESEIECVPTNSIAVETLFAAMKLNRDGLFIEKLTFYKDGWKISLLQCSITMEHLYMSSCVFSSSLEASNFAKSYQTFINIVRKKIGVHPNLVHYFFAQSRGSTVELFHECTSNFDLESLAKSKGKLSESQCKEVIRQLLETLNVLHKHSFFNGPIKCSDILIDSVFNVRLRGYIENMFALYTTEYFLMPCPEISAGIKVRESVDIWSIGCLLLSLLSNKFNSLDDKYFEDNAISEKIRAEGIANYIAHILNISLTDKCRDFATLCLQVEPTSRPTAQFLLQHEWMTQSEEIDKFCKIKLKTHESHNFINENNEFIFHQKVIFRGTTVGRKKYNQALTNEVKSIINHRVSIENEVI